MKFIKDLFRNGRKATKLIITFLILLIIWFAYDAKAEDYVTIEGGVTGISMEPGSASLNIISRWDDKWILGLGLRGEDEFWGQTVPNTPFVFGQRIVYGPGIFDKVGLGIGAAYLSRTTPANGSKFNYMLSIEYYDPRPSWFPDYYVFRHMSNAGSSPPNPGLDALYLGYVFGK